MVSRTAIAALPLRAMTHLIWLHGLETMRPDQRPLLFSALVHPRRPGRWTSHQDCIRES